MQNPVVPHHEPRCHREQTTALGHLDYGKARSCVPAPALTPPPTNGERNPMNTKSDYAISLLKPCTGSQETQNKSQSHWDLRSPQALALVALDLTVTASPVHLLWPRQQILPSAFISCWIHLHGFERSFPREAFPNRRHKGAALFTRHGFSPSDAHVFTCSRVSVHSLHCTMGPSELCFLSTWNIAQSSSVNI